MAADIVAFLRARLDEDERDRWRVHDQECEFGSRTTDFTELALPSAVCDCGVPARVLREVEAKRGRLALMAEATAEMDRLLADPHASRVDQAMAVGRARGATVAVRHDAAVYAGHPDFDPAWAER